VPLAYWVAVILLPTPPPPQESELTWRRVTQCTDREKNLARNKATTKAGKKIKGWSHKMLVDIPGLS
jgi:hypothetical protein